MKLSWFVLGLMASVTFVGILSELVPSGVLPRMTEDLGVSEAKIGFLVGVYALASAVCAIPLVSATLAVNRKQLLLVLLAGFAASNIVVAISGSYAVTVAFRIVGGVCADVATSVQSSVFNFSIMIATGIGGMLLTRFPQSGVKTIVYMSLICFILATILAFLSRRTLRSSSIHAGASHEEIHQRPNLPTTR